MLVFQIKIKHVLYETNKYCTTLHILIILRTSISILLPFSHVVMYSDYTFSHLCQLRIRVMFENLKASHDRNIWNI